MEITTMTKYGHRWPALRNHHAEYPAFSVGQNFSQDTAGHIALMPVRTAASPGCSQSEPLFTRAF
jgi:hypothetical protein